MRNSIKLILGVICITILLLFIFSDRDKSIEELIPLYTSPSSKFMPLMGMKVHYRDEGVQADSTPLILIHGMSSSLHTWDSISLIISPEKRVIRLDLPGFGLTGPSPDNTYNYDFYSRFIDSFTTRLQLKKFILVGNSMGGGIAWNYALHNPKAVDKLILIDAAGYPKKNERGSLGFKLASMPIINNLLLCITPKTLIRKSLETIYYDQKKVTEARVKRYHDMTIREGNREAALQIFKGSFATTIHKGQITNVNTPTLILWGEKDNVISVDNAERFRKDIKNSKAEIYKQVGHVPMEEVPGKVASSILSFVH